MRNTLGVKPDMTPNPRMRASVALAREVGIEGIRVLDIGCGFGWFEHAFVGGSTTQIVGIEPTLPGITTATDNLRTDYAKFAVAGALQLPFSDNSFDMVVAWEVLEHVPKRSEQVMFREVARVLKDGGWFLLSTPFDSRLSKFLDPAWWLVGHRHYSEEQLGAFARGASLIPVTQVRRGGVWALFSVLNMYVSKWLLRRPPVFGEQMLQKELAEYEEQKPGIATIFAIFQKAL